MVTFVITPNQRVVPPLMNRPWNGSGWFGPAAAARLLAFAPTAARGDEVYSAERDYLRRPSIRVRILVEKGRRAHRATRNSAGGRAPKPCATGSAPLTSDSRGRPNGTSSRCRGSPPTSWREGRTVTDNEFKESLPASRCRINFGPAIPRAKHQGRCRWVTGRSDALLLRQGQNEAIIRDLLVTVDPS